MAVGRDEITVVVPTFNEEKGCCVRVDVLVRVRMCA